MAPSILINPTLEACSRATGQTINPAANVGSQPLMTTQATRTPLLLQFAFARSRCGTGRLQDWSTDRHVRAFLASDPVRADKAVRAPVSSFVESALDYNAEKSSRRAQISWSACLPNGQAECIPLRV